MFFQVATTITLFNFLNEMEIKISLNKWDRLRWPYGWSLFYLIIICIYI